MEFDRFGRCERIKIMPITANGRSAKLYLVDFDNVEKRNRFIKICLDVINDDIYILFRRKINRDFNKG